MAGDAVDPVEAEGRSSQQKPTTRVDDSLCWFDMFNVRGERCGRGRAMAQAVRSHVHSTSDAVV